MNDKTLSLALAGNPNSGKTTMFNGLTGARQHVGNYPGITVDTKEACLTRGDLRLTILDLPGTYSLTAYTQEELVARKVLVEKKPDVVVDVLNASALERNLYLAVQFLELGVPVVLALNMMDEARRKGLNIDTDKLSELLDLPVVPTVARKGEGLDEVLDAAVNHAEARREQSWEPLFIAYGPDLDPVLEDMTRLIEESGLLKGVYPSRWVAVKYMEGDEHIMELGEKHGGPHQTLKEMVEKVSAHCQATLNTFPEALVADYRYGFIASLMRRGVLSREPLRDRIAMSDRMDKVLTQRLLGPLIMLGVLFAVYQITFTLGDTPMGWVEGFFGWLGSTADRLMPEGLLKSLIISGVIDGVGGVLSFVPLILIIFMLIAFLEDSGYMARVAYMMDRVFRAFGLHGCSVMPFIISGGVGGGCAVPGVMATRTLRSRREKLATLLTAPFMSCGAKLPVFILLAGVFFEHNQALVLFLITLTGWVAALVVARILRSTIIPGPSTPFVMELPPYRLPTLKGLFIHTWERTWQYIKKAGTVILAISILLWAAMTFPQAGTGDQEQDLRATVAGQVGTSLEPVTEWAGFDWRVNIALFGGVAAKEVIISTLGTAYSLGDAAEDTSSLEERLRTSPDWNRCRAVSLILFILLYAPCFVTVVAIKQEAGGWKWALFSIVFNTAFAFGLSVGVYQATSWLVC